MAGSQAKLTCHTIPEQARASAPECTSRQGCWQAAVNKPYVVWFWSLVVLVHASESLALACKQAGPGRPAKQSGATKYVLCTLSQKSSVCDYVHGCTLQKREKCRTKSNKRSYTSMYSVHTGTYHFMTLKNTEVCTGCILLSPSIMMYLKTYI